MNTTKTTDAYISGMSFFFAGVAAGLAAGILFAPLTGAETRGLIKRKAEEGTAALKVKAGEGRTYVKQAGADLLDQTQELVDRGTEAVANQKQKLADAFDAGRTAYRAAVSKPEHPY